MHLQRMPEDGNILSNEVGKPIILNLNFIVHLGQSSVPIKGSTCLMWKPMKNNVKTNDMTEVKRLDSEMVFMELVASMVEQNTFVIHDIETHAREHKNSCSLLMI